MGRNASEMESEVRCICSVLGLAILRNERLQQEPHRILFASGLSSLRRVNRLPLSHGEHVDLLRANLAFVVEVPSRAGSHSIWNV